MTYFTGLFIASGLYASIIFSDLASKAKGISFITLPASQFEKFMTGFFYVVVALPLMYTTFFYVFNTTALKISNSIRYKEYLSFNNADVSATAVVAPNGKESPAPDEKKEEFRPAPLVNVWKYEEDDRYGQGNYRDKRIEEPNIYFYVWAGLFIGQAFFALGSVYFGRFSFVKTFISILLLMLFFYFLSLFTNAVFRGEMFSYSYQADHQGVSYHLPNWVTIVDIWLLEFVLGPIFWMIAYVRLKETEI
jgi:hypothetical protein